MISISARVFLAMVIATMACGCTSDGRSKVEVPAVDPAEASARALELYDKDKSGSLSDAELAICPGIRAARERYDTDSDDQISRDEIAARLEALFSAGVGLTPVTCKVFRGSQPLAGAIVRFVPEKFLGDALKPAVGTTDDSGTASIAVAAEFLPDDQQNLRAMQPGVYRVQIEHANMSILVKPLGCEIDPSSRGGTEPEFRF